MMLLPDEDDGDSWLGRALNYFALGCVSIVSCHEIYLRFIV